MLSEKIDIFLVEDNDAVRLYLKTFLEKIQDFRIVGLAADGATAVEKIVELEPSVALVDIGLPIMDGVDVAREVKRKTAGVRVVMLTASDSQSNIFASLSAGADGYVLKGNYWRNLEMAVRSARMGAVWLDPGIAKNLLELAQKAYPHYMRGNLKSDSISLSPAEKELLGQVAESNCEDGVCLVDPAFIRKLERFSSFRSSTK